MHGQRAVERRRTSALRVSATYVYAPIFYWVSRYIHMQTHIYTHMCVYLHVFVAYTCICHELKQANDDRACTRARDHENTRGIPADTHEYATPQDTRQP
jgi:hypothetical protein